MATKTLVCARSFTTTLDDGSYFVAKQGTTQVQSDDPILKLWKDWFVALDSVAPGEDEPGTPAFPKEDLEKPEKSK